MPSAGETSKPMTGHSMAASSYTLVGGENLKAHVGHKVEITGTPDATAGQMPSSQSPSSSTSSSTSTMKPAVSTLKVQSLRMISSTCP
jgi:hypothetical protein